MKGIDYFTRNHWLTPIQERISLQARNRMFQRWLQLFPNSGSTVLDVGSTPDCERIDSNCFLKWLLDLKFKVSVVSPEDIGSIKNQFQNIEVLPSIPFNQTGLLENWNINSRSYEWVFSSAVIEHVGENFQQLYFIRECARVSDGIFITTPNRWHWLEFHTKLPFIHWLPKKIHRKILKNLGLDFWSKTENLNLLTKNEFIRIAQEALGEHFDFQVQTIWTLCMPSNLILLGKRKV